ncbi:MAG TPA: helix-turn-helix transcriptional regulator [Polyangiaceae bacterium]
MQRLRGEVKFNQDTLACRLGISKRTLSYWENGYWLPPFKQRLHVVVALREMPPQYVVEIAEALGVASDPAVATMLQPFRDALDEEDAEPVVAPPPLPAAPPPPPRPSEAEVRAAIDPIVREAADAMNVAANDLRAVLGHALGAAAEIGATLKDVQGAVVVRKKGGVRLE